MSRGSTPRHAQTAGKLGSAVQFNAETLWHFALSPGRSPQSNIPRDRPNVIKHAIVGYLMRVLH